MRTHVEICSASFPTYEGEEEEINPGVWGKRLAEFLSQKLNEEGIETEEIFSEDWGWAVPLKHQAFPMWIGAGNPQGPDQYLIFIEPSKPSIRRWFKKIDTTAAVERVAAALDRILTGAPDIREVRWWTEEEVNLGRTGIV